MTSSIKCDCNERIGLSINSIKLFEEIKTFFEYQTTAKIFEEIKPNIPYYRSKIGKEKTEWYATKWYRCKSCGCLWEFNYPDFPARGFVRKFPDGIYKPSKIVVDGRII